MACSPAQLASNRRNAAFSTGPKTLEGKARSRANSLKHGLTGAGIVLPTEDAAEVDRRFTTLEIAMNPSNDLAVELVKRVALLTVKLDRSADHEAKAISFRMRHAAEQFDDARLAEVEKAYSWIANEPATQTRRLRSSPEGIDRLVQGFQWLRDEIAHPDGMRWNWQSCEQLHYLMGRRRVEFPITRARALTEAIGGDFQHLRNADGGDLAKLDRQLWALDRMVDLIDAEIAAHKALRDKLDLAGLELDRAEAASRAYFDPSAPAILARKYEGAAERGLYRALREFREVQAEARLEAEAMAQQQLEADRAEELGSSLQEHSGEEDEATDVDAMTADTAESAVEGRSLDEQSTSDDRIRAEFPSQSTHSAPFKGFPAGR